MSVFERYNRYESSKKKKKKKNNNWQSQDRQRERTAISRQVNKNLAVVEESSRQRFRPRFEGSSNRPIEDRSSFAIEDRGGRWPSKRNLAEAWDLGFHFEEALSIAVWPFNGILLLSTGEFWVERGTGIVTEDILPGSLAAPRGFTPWGIIDRFFSSCLSKRI